VLKEWSDPVSDRQLLRDAQAGSEAAFNELVKRLTPGLFALAHRMLGDRDEAEGIVQEAWLRAWKALARVDVERPPWPWLAAITANAARDLLRRRRPLELLDGGDEPDSLPDDDPGPEVRLQRQQALESLAMGIRQLTADQRHVIALRYDAGLSYQEIAAALDLPLNTIRTHLRRGKLALRRWLEESDVRLDG
jgi:RNA polymerase sigma-70 factor (ECF subfamily)